MNPPPSVTETPSGADARPALAPTQAASLWPFFMSPLDIGLFIRSARTDSAIDRTRRARGGRAAFEAAYTSTSDPWGSASPSYTYQRRKYDKIMAALPPRRFRSALDLGCGLGLLSQRLTAHADTTLGLDLSQAAVELARGRASGVDRLRFAQADITDLPRDFDGCFDLVVIADTLYYLSPLTDAVMKQMAARVAELLTPGGVCVLANHFFFSRDRDSRLSRRIHDAFAWSPRFSVTSESRHSFFLVTVLEAAAQAAATPDIPAG